ncbi:hypothetical protein PIB30_010507 [Stylosanthes scabra]|uniref:Aminotransferase-like plant mobile domain-containing protein n=1 Tax=Stylosanthes scabra TaxID=79078 RepID=A0ABU6Q5N3_9FABA|nr:hypothetical protein [Stylosanthes scabra]
MAIWPAPPHLVLSRPAPPRMGWVFGAVAWVWGGYGYWSPRPVIRPASYTRCYDASSIARFCCLDLTEFYVDSCLCKLAKYLRYSLSNADRYAKKLTKSRRILKSHSKDKQFDARPGSYRSKGVVNEDQTQCSKKKKYVVKYTYSNWSRYYFRNFHNGKFVPAPDDIHVDLRKATFVSYWLNKYVFLRPVDECMSHEVFLLECLIARGKRVLLTPLYLGGLYARLDKFSEQLEIAHGRFSFLAYIDEIFL